MSKTKSVMEQVKEFIATHPKFKVIDVKAGLASLPRNQVGTAVWKLEKTNVVRKISADEYELTPVNNTAQPAVNAKPAKAKPKAKRRAKTVTMTDRATVAERDNIFLKSRIEDMTRRMTTLNNQYEDALAIIRYLENKLFIAIQFNAKNNGNT